MIRYTEEEYQQTVNRVRGGRPALAAVQAAVPSLPDKRQDAPSPFRSKGEAKFAQSLHMDKLAGDILAYWYEPLNFRLLGKKNFYKPDFLVQTKDGLVFYEVKGRNKSDDRSLIKIKTAAAMNPWAKFFQIRLVRGTWVPRAF